MLRATVTSKHQVSSDSPLCECVGRTGIIVSSTIGDIHDPEVVHIVKLDGGGKAGFATGQLSIFDDDELPSWMDQPWWLMMESGVNPIMADG